MEKLSQSLGDKDCVLVNIRLPKGNKLVAKFEKTSQIQVYYVLKKLLYDFIECNEIEPIDLLCEFVVINTYPRREFTDKTISFLDAGLYPSATVIIENIDEK